MKLPMIDLMDQSFRAALKSGRVGTPVAVRLIAYRDATAEAILPHLSGLLDRVSQWMGSDVQRVCRAGDVNRGEVTVLASCSDGQTALISVGACRENSTAAEAVLIGRHGMALWEGGDGITEGLTHPETVSPLLSTTVDTVAAPQELQTDCGVLFGQPRSTTATPSPVGVLLVSGDHTHQPGYAAAFASDDRCRLVAITDDLEIEDRRRQLNEQLATYLGLAYLEDFNEALKRPDVHAVSICAEPYRRGSMAVRAARAGKHLYMDKPLCATVQEAAEIRRAAATAQVVGHMFSSVRSDVAARAQRVINSGQLGTIVAAHVDLCFAKGHPNLSGAVAPRHEQPLPKRFELPDAKRELTNIGVYGLVWLLWLLRRRATCVTASTGNFFFEEHRRQEMEDFGQLLIELEGGIVASVAAGRTGWSSHPAGGLQRMTILGTQGTAVIDAARPRVEVWAAGPAWSAPPRDPEDPMGMWFARPGSEFAATPRDDWHAHPAPAWADDTRYFIDCIQNGVDSDVSMDLAAHCTEILTAAYWSAAAGQTVSLRAVSESG